MTEHPQPARHPSTCHGCEGTGWQPGPPIPTNANGTKFDYTTVTPCQHNHWEDDPDTDTHGYDRFHQITLDEALIKFYARADRGEPVHDIIAGLESILRRGL
jgi:hypothetical protein